MDSHPHKTPHPFPCICSHSFLAGGHGALTFELQAVHGVPCTLIEPRPFTLSKGQRRYLELQQRDKLQQQQQQQDVGIEADIIGGAIGREAAEGAAASSDQDPDLDPDQDQDLDPDQGMFDGACLDLFMQQRSPAEEVESADGSGSRSRSPEERAAVGSHSGTEAAAAREGDTSISSPLLPAAACVGDTSVSSPLLTVREAGFVQLQACFTPDLWGASRLPSSGGALSPAAATTTAPDQMALTSVSPDGTTTGDSGGAAPAGSSGVTESNTSSGAPFSEAVRLHLASCSLVVGLHPDQATDSILEFALAHGKPFAIVPCCVFPTLFTNRRLRGGGNRATELLGQSVPVADGDLSAADSGACDSAAADVADDGVGGVPVVSHGQLVAYLAERGGSGCRVVQLPLMGANTVVYRKGA